MWICLKGRVQATNLIMTAKMLTRFVSGHVQINIRSASEKCKSY